MAPKAILAGPWMRLFNRPLRLCLTCPKSMACRASHHTHLHNNLDHRPHARGTLCPVEVTRRSVLKNRDRAPDRIYPHTPFCT